MSKPADDGKVHEEDNASFVHDIFRFIKCIQGAMCIQLSNVYRSD